MRCWPDGGEVGLALMAGRWWLEKGVKLAGTQAGVDCQQQGHLYVCV